MDLAALIDSATQVLSIPRPVLDLVRAPDATTADEVLAAVAAEPLFAAQVVRLANSPFFRLPRRFVNVDDVAVALGARPLRSLAVAVGALDVFLTSPVYGGPAWGHALNAATLARSLAVYVGGVDPDAAFVAGMFHDVGKVAMSELLDGYPLMTTRHVAPDGPEAGPPTETAFVHAERALYGFEHQEVAAALLEKWQVDGGVVDAVRTHHWPAEAGRLGRIVHVADALADGAGTSDGYVRAAIDEQAAATLEVSVHVLEEIGRTATIVDDTAPRPLRVVPGGVAGEAFPPPRGAPGQRRWFSRP